MSDARDWQPELVDGLIEQLARNHDVPGQPAVGLTVAGRGSTSDRFAYFFCEHFWTTDGVSDSPSRKTNLPRIFIFFERQVELT